MKRKHRANDTLRTLVNELSLDEYDPYGFRKENFRFIRLIPGEPGYDCFLFVAPGGSGTEQVEAYNERSGKYEMVNNFGGFFDTLPGTITRGHYDILDYFKDYERGSTLVLYKWNGKRYAFSKVVSVNEFPLELLITMGIIDERKISSTFPFIAEKDGYESRLIYGKLYMDTLYQGQEEKGFLIRRSSNPHYGYDMEWLIKYRNGKYIKMSEEKL